MTKDPIIAEIHETRRILWLESGGTSKSYAAFLTKAQKKYADRIITASELKKRRGGKRKSS